MENLFKSDIKQIKEASLANKLVIFVGAGVSSNSGIPSWPELIENLKIELPKQVNDTENDQLKIAQLFKNYRDKKEYLDKIRLTLKYGDASFNPIHEILFTLNPAHVVTTNFDDLLEQAISSNNLQFYKVKKDKDIPYAAYSRLLIKMHGDLEEGNIVLTEDDYLNYQSNFPLTETYIKSLFASKLILFIGFSFNDYNLKVITNKVMNLLGNDFQPMYFLNIGETDLLRRDYYKKRGVRIVDYMDLIDKELDGTYNKKEIEDLQKLQNEKGKKLYKFILYINKYDPFTEDNKGKDCINFLFDSIQYFFNELQVVGGTKILKFFPFSSEKEARYSLFTLNTNNTQIWNLHEGLKLSIEAKRKFIAQFQKQYHEIVNFSLINGINWIRKIDGKGRVRACFELKPKGKNIPQDGVDIFYELNFIKLFHYIDDLKNTQTKEISPKSMELPYLLYKIGAYFEAYVQFKELALGCWKEKKYILYFICQNNLKNLERLIENTRYAGKKFDSNLLDNILEEIKRINLQDILSRIQFRNKEIYNTLNEISDFQYVYKILYSINRLTERITESKEIAKHGGFSSNSDVDELTEKTWLLWSFTNNNFIASEHFSDHLYVYKKAFEGFVISNSISESKSRLWGQTSKLEYLDPFHLMIVVFRIDLKYIKGIFETYHIEKLSFNSTGLEFIEKLIVNGIDSTTLTNTDNHQVLNDLLFGALNNLLLISSKSEFRVEFYNEMVTKLIMIKSVDFHKIEESFKEFIGKHNQHIDILQLKQLFSECILRNNSKFLPVDLMILLLELILHQESSFKLIDKKLLDNLITSERIEDYNCRRLVIPLYRIIPECYQLKLREIINQRLNSNFDQSVFQTSYYNSIPLDEKTINDFISLMVDYFKGKSVSSDEDYNILILHSIYKKEHNRHIKSRIRNLTKTVPFLKFLISPNDFSDYDSFNPEWMRWLSRELYQIYGKNKQIKTIIKKKLKEPDPQEWLLEVYFEYF